MQTEPIVFERIFDAPVSKVWDAISNDEAMKKWYFDVPGFKAEPGFEFSFLAGDDQKKYLHLCKVTEAIVNEKLSYTWRYDGYEGDSEVSFELFPEGEKTKLVLTHKGLETFMPEKNPQFGKENFTKGWTYLVGTALKNFVEKTGS